MRAKRFLASLLAAITLFSLLPTAALAAEDPASEEEVVVQEQKTPAPAASGSEAPVNHTVTINYTVTGWTGSAPADPYVAEIAEGTGFTSRVKLPVVQGYEYDTCTYLTDAVSVSVADGLLTYTVANIQQDVTITVNYKPAMNSYKAEYWLQNADDDEYTLTETKSFQGLTDAPISKSEVEAVYAGFAAPVYDDSVRIAADGSTVVKLYYDRQYYKILFDLDGGMDGPDPIYGRFGSAVGAVTAPRKPGYVFDGWEPALPGTVPAADGTYKAKWKLSGETANVSVVLWGENANDTDYSYLASYNTQQPIGSSYTVSGMTGLQNVYTCGKEEHTHSDACRILTCSVEEHTHARSCYSGVGDRYTGNTLGWTGSANGALHKRNNNNTYYIYLDGSWYVYTGNRNNNNTAATPTCGKTAHTHSISSCYTYTCGLEEHTHNNACRDTSVTDLYDYNYATTVTVAADGSSVVNVYLTRKQFTWTFKDGNRTLGTITGKWGQYVFDRFQTISANTYGSDTNKWKWLHGSEYVGLLTYMGTSNESYSKTDYTANTTFRYWMQNIDAGTTHTSTDYTRKYECPAYSGNSVSSGDFLEFEGFTYERNVGTGTKVGSRGQDFYYRRNSYDLVLNNGKENVQTYSVPFEKILGAVGGVSSYVPAKPDTVSEGYAFGGWYLNPQCTGEQVDLSTKQMPAANLVLYAKWVPVTCNVTAYTDADLAMQWGETQTVGYGTMAEPVAPPADEAHMGYQFIGWFYRDENGIERLFDFETMPVQQAEMKVYAKWASNYLVNYRICFVDDRGITIGEPVNGKAMGLSSRTFEAKLGAALYAGYQEGYYPVAASHSIEFSPRSADYNAAEDLYIYRFVYKQADKVPYTVKYVYEDGTKVFADKVVNDNSKAVVTEYPLIKQGYLARPASARLVLQLDENGNPDTDHNVIVFVYEANTVQAYISETHYYSKNGVRVDTRSGSTELGTIGESYSRDARDNAEGYILSEVEVTAQGDEETAAVLATYTAAQWAALPEAQKKFELSAAGLHFRFYYTYDLFFVHHSATGVTDEHSLSALTGKFNLAGEITANTLYGGYYSDIRLNKSYACTEDGTAMTPVAGETYYLKEVNQNYLKPQYFYFYDKNCTPANQVVRVYLVTAVDDGNYLEVGFVGADGKMVSYVDGNGNAVTYQKGNAVTEKITVKNYNGKEYQKDASKNFAVYDMFYGMPSTGYLYTEQYYTKADGALESCTYTPYWITPDGVKVTGILTRTITAGDGIYGGSFASSTSWGTSSVSSAASAPVMTAARPKMMMKAAAAVLTASPAAEYTINKVMNDMTVAQKVTEGDNTGKINYAAKSGYQFGGWYTDADYTTAADFSSVAQDMTVYAKYIANWNITTSLVKTGSKSGTVNARATVNIDGQQFSEAGVLYSFDGKTVRIAGSETTNPVGRFVNAIFKTDLNITEYTVNLSFQGLSNRDTVTVTPYWVTLDGTTVYGNAQTYTYYLGMLIRK